MRQILLDTETTGLEPKLGHRIIEVVGVEMINRRLTGNDFHRYLNPERDINVGAIQVHGLTRDFLADKAKFADIADELLDYLRGAEVVIHNAPFDVGFLNAELERLGKTPIETLCKDADHLVYHNPKHRSDSPRDLVLTPLELIDKIAALIPPPRAMCQSPMCIIAFITEGSSVRKILDHLGESAQPPRTAPARGPPLWEAAMASERAGNDPQWKSD